jgi:hypothetical protein
MILDMENSMSAMRKVVKTARFVMAVKGGVGCAVLALALVGVTVPHFLGVPPTIVGEGAAAGIGGVIGALAALRG